jgi:hypothetical protein
MRPEAESAGNEKRKLFGSLESIIAMGLFGWLALSITLMGLGIW